MARKEWKPVPESELTEEEVRRWFNRLRELYQGEKNHVHEIKLERWKLRAEKFDLLHEIKVLKRENRLLTEKIEKMESQAEKKVEKKEKLIKEKKKENSDLVDFRKKFFDSL